MAKYLLAKRSHYMNGTLHPKGAIVEVADGSKVPPHWKPVEAEAPVAAKAPAKPVEAKTEAPAKK